MIKNIKSITNDVLIPNDCSWNQLMSEITKNNHKKWKWTVYYYIKYLCYVSFEL